MAGFGGNDGRINPFSELAGGGSGFGGRDAARGERDGRVVSLFGRRQERFDPSQLAESFRRRPSTNWSIAEAYLAVLLSAASADGRISQDERQVLLWVSERTRGLAGMTLQSLSEANDRAIARLQEGGYEALQDACDSLPADLLEPLFAHCCWVALADGQLVPEESRFLQELAEVLKIPGPQAEKILEVMLIVST